MDFHKENAPDLKIVNARTLQGQVALLGEDEFVVNGQTTQIPRALDYQVIEAANTRTLDRVTNASTGTKFLLTDNGL